MANEDDIQDAIENDDESQFHPLLRSQPSTRSNTPRPSTSTSASQTPFESQAEDTADEDIDTSIKKRSREPASLQPRNKKHKVSSVGIMEKISDDISVIASAYASDVASQQYNIQEAVGNTLQGQAQESIQEEACLTDDGQLVMLELLADTNIARTFLAIKKEELKAKWIKKQLEKYIEKVGGDITKLYID